MQKDHLDHVAMTTGGVSGVRVIKETCRATFRDAPCTRGDVEERKHKYDRESIHLEIGHVCYSFLFFFSCIML